MSTHVEAAVRAIPFHGYDAAADQARAAWAAVWAAGGSAVAAVVGAWFAARAGAKFGARAARQMAREADAEKEALRNLRGLNVAMALIGSEVTACFGLKRQYVFKVQTELHRVRGNFLSWDTNRQLYGRANVGPFPFDADISEMGFPAGMMDSAREALLKDADPDPTSIVLFGHLATACANLRAILNSINGVTAEIRNMPPDAHSERAILYLGLPRPQGGTDARYPMLVEGLRQQTDDALIFGRVLCAHLEERAAATRAKLGPSAPAPLKQDFSRIDQLGMYPDETELRPVLAAAGVGRFKDAVPAEDAS